MPLYPLSNAWDTKYVTVSNTWARKDTVTSYLTKYTLWMEDHSVFIVGFLNPLAPDMQLENPTNCSGLQGHFYNHLSGAVVLPSRPCHCPELQTWCCIGKRRRGERYRNRAKDVDATILLASAINTFLQLSISAIIFLITRYYVRAWSIQNPTSWGNLIALSVELIF